MHVGLPEQLLHLGGSAGLTHTGRRAKRSLAQGHRPTDEPSTLLDELWAGSCGDDGELIATEPENLRIRQALTEKLDCHPMRRGEQPNPAQGMWQVGG